MRSIRITYDANGRSVHNPRRLRRVVLVVLAVLVLIWIVGYTLFNVGGTVPGTGEGDLIQRP